MPYIFDTANSLIRVLTHAASLSPHRMAGYAANADFWLGEVEHCFALIDGYAKRFYAMRHAINVYVTEHPLDPGRADKDTSTTDSIKDFELNEARQSVATAARDFFRRCIERGLLSQDLKERVDRLLNLERLGD